MRAHAHDHHIPSRGARSLGDTADPVRVAYDALAPAYDAFTASYRHDLWLAEIGRLAIAHGLEGRRQFDVACGTGKSLLPLLERGYAVIACDLSPEMVRRAAGKAPTARVLVADMRCLPALRVFDLVTCLNDAVNYLLDPIHVANVFAGIARHLAPQGVAVWDVNTLHMVRSTFSSDWVADRGEWFLTWRRGLCRRRLEGHRRGPGSTGFATAMAPGSGRPSHHRHRHWPIDEIMRLAREAGLDVLQVLGQHRGARLETTLDEHITSKR